MSRRVGVRVISKMQAQRAPLTPSASDYADVQGSIWLQGNPGGYGDSHQGQIYMPDPSGLNALNNTQGGNYADRHS